MSYASLCSLVHEANLRRGGGLAALAASASVSAWPSQSLPHRASAWLSHVPGPREADLSFAVQGSSSLQNVQSCCDRAFCRNTRQCAIPPQTTKPSRSCTCCSFRSHAHAARGRECADRDLFIQHQVSRRFRWFPNSERLGLVGVPERGLQQLRSRIQAGTHLQSTATPSAPFLAQVTPR